MNEPEDNDQCNALAEQWWVGIAIWIGVVSVYFLVTTCKLP
jgi:hypothetical protein